ncbi:MarR family transcriptional regulator [Paraburkholderia sp. CNPSo 3281]|nr:MarR family transcriptional regulator [Paraburkholderia sp. CNPSo 3281]
MLLLRARELLMQRFRPIIGSYGITDQQWRVLRTLYEKGPLEPRQISQMCAISNPSLAGVLSRMEEASWVRRDRFTTDRRRVLVSLIPASVERIAQIAREIEERYLEIENTAGTLVAARVYSAVNDLLNGLGKNDGEGDEFSESPTTLVCK